MDSVPRETIENENLSMDIGFVIADNDNQHIETPNFADRFFDSRQYSSETQKKNKLI